MTRTEAHHLLNAARCGADPSEAEITQALQATGDLPRAAAPTSRSTTTEPPQALPVASFLNRSGRVMRGAGDVVQVSA